MVHQWHRSGSVPWFYYGIGSGPLKLRVWGYSIDIGKVLQSLVLTQWKWAMFTFFTSVKSVCGRQWPGTFQPRWSPAPVKKLLMVDSRTTIFDSEGWFHWMIPSSVVIGETLLLLLLNVNIGRLDVFNMGIEGLHIVRYDYFLLLYLPNLLGR